ncbi:membrane protein [Vibrio navarrensis]|uniref:porin family protein n=1 Tax=Vibrio navarrensis TaxID=29495 RepID=UPI00052E34DD|nr:porin family protein [Vibrio navarrensis]KGK20165.1 membrane protein [Vibrio navarrensis]
MRRKAITLTILSFAAVSTAHAESNVQGFYIGGGVGSTDFDSDESVDGKADGSALKLIAGYQFNLIVGIEAQYNKYGDIKLTNPVNTWSPTTLSINANLGYSFDNGFRPYGLVGISTLDLSETAQTLEDDQGTAIHFGLGLEYAPPVLAGLAFRIGYDSEIFSISTIDEQNSIVSNKGMVYSIGAAYAGVTYKF